MATVIGCAFFGAIGRLFTVTTALFRSLSIPEMRSYKHSDKLIAGVHRWGNRHYDPKKGPSVSA